jgi:hypothetical protein
MDGWMDGLTYGWMDGWTDVRMEGWMDGRMDGRMDGWTDKNMNEIFYQCYIESYLNLATSGKHNTACKKERPKQKKNFMHSISIFSTGITVRDRISNEETINIKVECISYQAEYKKT